MVPASREFPRPRKRKGKTVEKATARSASASQRGGPARERPDEPSAPRRRRYARGVRARPSSRRRRDSTRASKRAARHRARRTAAKKRAPDRGRGARGRAAAMERGAGDAATGPSTPSPPPKRGVEVSNKIDKECTLVKGATRARSLPRGARETAPSRSPRDRSLALSCSLTGSHTTALTW